MKCAGSFNIVAWCLLTLVYELVEGVLSVGAWLPPHDGACLVSDPASTASYVLSVRLHVPLLEVCSKPVHVLWGQNMAVSAFIYLHITLFLLLEVLVLG